ncbi:MAG: hypothetical protein HY960_08045 [Ignavibacteriae bacterium]|nr:hypothetical protein [Ignavibacteriota bacterium]
MKFPPTVSVSMFRAKILWHLFPQYHLTKGNSVPSFVSVIDISTKLVRKNIEVGSFAAGIVFVK